MYAVVSQSMHRMSALICKWQQIPGELLDASRHAYYSSQFLHTPK